MCREKKRDGCLQECGSSAKLLIKQHKHMKQQHRHTNTQRNYLSHDQLTCPSYIYILTRVCSK